MATLSNNIFLYFVFSFPSKSFPSILVNQYGTVGFIKSASRTESKNK